LLSHFSHEFTFFIRWHSARYSLGMKRKLILFSLAVVTAVGFVGCASDHADRDSHKRTTGRYIDDKMLTMKVKGALGDSDVYKFPHVDVSTFNGTVQLTGFVDTPEQKQKAEEIVRNVRGVESVQNQISLKGDTERVRGTTDRDYNYNRNTVPPSSATPTPTQPAPNP
jgi:hypothetical protein